MSAMPKLFLDQDSKLRLERMGKHNLDDVMKIELDVFPFPWTYQTFASTIDDGYECWVMCDTSNVIVGYFVVMQVVDEAHLLTIAVHRDLQGQGIGLKLVNWVIELARAMKMQSLLLEVRPSNLRALDIYLRYGFSQIGRRKNYYSAPNGTREDALVMRLKL